MESEQEIREVEKLVKEVMIVGFLTSATSGLEVYACFLLFYSFLV